MTPSTLRLVLLISCAHALVHVYEQALPSVEQLVAADFSTAEVKIGPETTGPLGTAWRVPFGALALLAGWLADRLGSKSLLIVYLTGCAATSALAWWSPTLAALFVAMFVMGSFASIYHPAGLAMISHETTAANRGAALGWHGIFGSVGIAVAPLLASAAFLFPQASWREYYLLLIVPGAALAVLFVFVLPGRKSDDDVPRSVADNDASEDSMRWGAFFTLVAAGTASGFIYAALTHFLPRYLDTAGLRPASVSAESFRTLLTGIVLLCGAAGQGVAGKLARPQRLEWLLVLILAGNAPCLIWMALATGHWRLAATCVMAFVHFMNQPVYNSLIAKFVARGRRSTGYGFSNMMCFGIGALGPTYAGLVRYLAGPTQADLWTYASLAGLALLAALLAAVLWRNSVHAES